MKKSCIYIDGSNLYFAVKSKSKCKIDIKKFCNKLTEDCDLVEIKYYIAPVKRLSNPEMYAEQQKFFEKLKKIPKLKIVFGRLEKRKKDGKEYFVEKATDVNLALDLVLDAQANVYDEAFLVLNDGDFSGAVKAVIERFNKKVTYVAVDNNKTISYHLKSVASKTKTITQNFINEVCVGE